jgi:hypothetical protein
LFFNENLYKPARWTVEMPGNGFAALLPMFLYDTNEEDEELLEKTPTI